MSSKNKILASLLNKQINFCCLCWDIINEEETIHIKDEVVVNVNGSESMVQMSEVLQCVLGHETYHYLMIFDIMCDKCTRATICSYTFIQISRKNAEYMANILEALTNSLEHTTDDLYNSKSLYISLNLKDFTSKQLYDCKQMPNNTTAVLRRFQKIENTSKMKFKNVELNKIEKELKSKKTRCSVPSVMSMLLDANDPDSIKCKECFNSYPTLWSLKSHYIRVHAPKKFKCPECPRSYGSKAYLEAHKKESHCTAVCSECGKTFYNRHTLKMHEIGHHMTIICPDCGRIYKNKTTFKKHKELNVCGRKTRADPSDAKFTCDYCNKKYTQKVSLRVHIQYEHGNYKAHICEWCGKKFWAQSRLKAHIVKHTREKNFSCAICGGKFVTKESLLYHTRTHTGERPYECSECNSKFLSASRRSEHMKRHHAGATLECNICHCKFNSRSYLQKHKKTHVNNDSESTVQGHEIKVKYLVDKTKNSNNGVDVTNDCKKQVTSGNQEFKYKFKHEVCEDNTQSDCDDQVYLEVCDDDDGDQYVLS